MLMDVLYNFFEGWAEWKTPVRAAPQPAAAQPKRRLPIGLVVALVFLSLVVVGCGNAPEATPADATPTEVVFVSEPPVVQDSHSLTAGQGSYSDPAGASLAIPVEALPSEEALTLETANLGSAMQEELEQSYTIDSAAYSLVAAAQDGAGRATLSIPAPSEASRLAVLVDDQYLALLPGAPENGMLTADLFLGAPGAAEGYPTLAQATQPNRYFVVTPKASSAVPSGGSVYMASMVQEPDIVSCIPRIWHGNRCWTNAAGSVVVLFWNTEMPSSISSSDPLRPPEVIDGVIRTVTQVMSTYQGAGFSNAAISSSNPVYIVISAKESEPNYSQKTGNVYLGWGVINELAAGSDRCTIAHELFHWIQDEAYMMNGAALVNDRAWFLEMGAENGSFLIDPACLGQSLSTYGFAEVENQLAWQATPFQWDWGEGARYIHALQMYISICDGGRCVMSQSEFARLTSSGQYPSAGAYETYYANADDMGRYLLGSSPLLARSDAAIPAALRSGMGYGDYIWLKQSPSPKVDISLNAGRIKTTGTMEATVGTTIEKGGVYPLWVSNGRGTPAGGADGYTTLPGLLTISAGTPLWYSLDNGAPVFHDGGEELEIGALSAELGVGLVRLVATAPDAQKQFIAEVKPVELSGDWVHILSNTTTTSMNCPESEDPLQAADFVSYLSGYGTFVADPAVTDGTRYIWEGEIPDFEGVIEATIQMTPEEITLDYLIDIPRPADTSWLPWALPGAAGGLGGWQPAPAPPFGLILALAGLLILAAALPVWLRRRFPQVNRPGLGRGLALVTSALLVAVWLSSCFGMQMWGTFSGTYTFTRLETAQSENLPVAADADAEALQDVEWVATGTGEIHYDLHILVVTEDADGNEVEEEGVCQASFSTGLQGVVGPADMVTLDDDE